MDDVRVPIKTLEDGPIVLRQFFDQETHQQIKDYVDNNFKYFPRTVDDVFVRTGVHNNPFFYSIHQQLTEVASEVFGEPVMPSYVFLSMYKDGGRCPLHIDRDPCRFTIDYLISQEQENEWPLRISSLITDVQRESGINVNYIDPRDSQDLIDPDASKEFKSANPDLDWHTVLLKENDAVGYSGTHSWHYRPTKILGSANLVFFHYVPINYRGGLS